MAARQKASHGKISAFSGRHWLHAASRLACPLHLIPTKGGKLAEQSAGSAHRHRALHKEEYSSVLQGTIRSRFLSGVAPITGFAYHRKADGPFPTTVLMYVPIDLDAMPVDFSHTYVYGTCCFCRALPILIFIKCAIRGGLSFFKWKLFPGLSHLFASPVLRASTTCRMVESALSASHATGFRFVINVAIHPQRHHLESPTRLKMVTILVR